MRKENGITLIALVITIIVLLILAGVTVATLTGDNGLLTKAGEAKEKSEIAELMERVKLDLIEEASKNDNTDERTQLRNVLTKYFNDVPNPLPNDLNSLILTAKSEYGGYENVDVSEVCKHIKSSTPTYDPTTLTIGTAINTDKYGWKVKNYQISTTEFSSGVWRLFFQDQNYTYLITDSCVGNYLLDEYTSSYTNGANVSEEAKRLNYGILSMFTDNYRKNYTNMSATAYLTDTSDTGPWVAYKNSDAVFAIGSPTIELFVASYNNRSNNTNQINLVATEDGYYTNTQSNWLQSSENHGIYNKGDFWISSPCYDEEEDLTDYLEMKVNGTSGNISNDFILEFSNAVRPIVCIPTSVFNSKYGTSANLVNE